MSFKQSINKRNMFSEIQVLECYTQKTQKIDCNIFLCESKFENNKFKECHCKQIFRKIEFISHFYEFKNQMVGNNILFSV